MKTIKNDELNNFEFCVYGNNALFTDPVFRLGGEKITYPIPTYEAMKGVCKNIYWKPAFIWVIDRIKIMNEIQTQFKGEKPIKDITAGKKNETSLSYYTYLTNVRYKVRAHIEWNGCRDEDFLLDRNIRKHSGIMKREIEKGGRRNIFLGAKECQAYVEPCVYDDPDDLSYYHDVDSMRYGRMYYGLIYPDETIYIAENGLERTEKCYTAENNEKNPLAKIFWNEPEVRNGELVYPHPIDGKGLTREFIRSMKPKVFKNPNKDSKGKEEGGKQNVS